MDHTQTFQPTFGRVLTIAVTAIAVVSLVLTAIGDVGDALRYLGPTLLIPALTWALFWRPAVTVGTEGVEMRNVAQSVDIPWESIESVDTKYSLTITAGDRTWSAWAAPAPGMVAARRANRAEGKHLPPSTYASGAVRPGDLTSSLSGQAALMIRRELESRTRDHSSPPASPGSSAQPHVHWHWDVLAVVGALAIWTLVVVLT